MGSGRAVRERNTKHQTSNTREIPESKHQKPSSKHQRNPKFQAPNRGPRFELRASLVFGAWCFVFGALIGGFLTRQIPRREANTSPSFSMNEQIVILDFGSQ